MVISVVGSVIGMVVCWVVGSIVGIVVGSVVGRVVCSVVGIVVGSVVGSGVTGGSVTSVGDSVRSPPSADAGTLTMVQSMQRIIAIRITARVFFTLSHPVLV
jgi:outer membrane lipoprotein SlyB